MKQIDLNPLARKSNRTVYFGPNLLKLCPKALSYILHYLSLLREGNHLSIENGEPDAGN